MAEAVAHRPIGRGLRILIGVAAALVAALAVRSFADVLAPVFLAVVLSLAAQPVRRLPGRLGLPAWLGTVLSLVVVYAVVAALVIMLGVAAGRFASLLEQYAPQLESFANQLVNQAQDLGLTSGQLGSVKRSLDPGRLIKLASAAVGGAAGVLSSLFFIITLLFFTITDASAFADKLACVSPAGERLADGFHRFARGTRQYLAVSTVFGFIVAICDVLALLLLDVPYAWLWGLLAFITNYIPTIGFLIGLLPPAIVALLDHGPGTAVVVAVVYCVLNVLIQTVIQPRVVGSAVGLSATLSFLSLIIWTTILGGIGALLAVPLTLFVKAQLVDVDPEQGWLSPLLSAGGSAPGSTPDHSRSRPERERERSRARRRGSNEDPSR